MLRRRRPTPTLKRLRAAASAAPGAEDTVATGPCVVVAATADQVSRFVRRSGGEGVVAMVGCRVRELHRRFTALPPVALVVDLRSAEVDAQVRAWRELFFHLDPGAVWVVVHAPDTVAGERLLGEIDRHRKRGTALGASVGAVATGPGFTVVVKSQRHLLKLRDAQAATLLPVREPGLHVSVLASKPADELVPAGTTTSYGGHDPGFDSRFPLPELQVRRYDGRLVLPRTTLVHSDRSVLPDSFRYHLADKPKVSGLSDVRGDFGLPEEPPSEPEVLEGSFYHFGYNHPGHFGHLMTEALARLWGWEHAKTADPGLKVLCRLHPDPARAKPPEHRLESLLLPAFGIDPGDIVWADGPVAVEHLVSATPMWHNTPPYYVHPDIRAVWHRLRKGLGDGTATTPELVFVTRPPRGNRRCRNQAEVEAVFAEHGFTVVEPSTLPVPAQAALFAGARVIAGFGGSAMYNMVYAENVTDVIVLNHTAYTSRSEHLFASVHGAHSHWFWSEPDLPHPDGGFLRRAFQSSWTFDLRRNGDDLRRLLHRLVD